MATSDDIEKPDKSNSLTRRETKPLVMRPSIRALAELLDNIQLERNFAEESISGLEDLIDGVVTPTSLVKQYRETARRGRRKIRDLLTRIQVINDYIATRQTLHDSED